MHALLLAATLALAGSATRAPSADEQRLYDEGLRAFQGGDARAAEKAWKAGYALAHDPAFLVHIAEAQEKAGAPADAADTYRRYLREAPDAADRADIEQRIARLAPGAPTPAAPTAAPPGETPGEFGASPPTPDLRPPAPPRTNRAPVPATDSERAPGPAPATEDLGWNRYNITAVAAGSAAALLLGAAGLFAAQAGSDEDDVNRLVNYRDSVVGRPLEYSVIADQYEKAMADGPRHARYAKIALVGSVVAAAVSAAFFVLDARLAAEPAVAIVPDGRGIAATGGVRWSF